MDLIYTLKNSLHESRIFLSRIVVAFVVILLLTLCLIIRLLYLQISGYDYYLAQANNNRIKVLPLPPTRGIIYDRNGKILATNMPSYSLEIIPEQTKDLAKTLTQLQKLLNIPAKKIEQFHAQRKRKKSFLATPLIIRMSDEQLAKFAVERPYFPSVDINAHLIRHYPYEKFVAHAVGYVGRINASELKKIRVKSYYGTHYIGKVGIEKNYESNLHGQNGYAEVETNAQSKLIKTLRSVPPTPGDNLYLTLDIALQESAYNAFGQYKGAITALEIPSGNVLVLASSPGFDPNVFVSGISNKEYKALQDFGKKPLFNRAIHGQYPPGSVVKPFIALAGLEYQVATLNQKLFCRGFYQLPNVKHRYRDWKKQGHGVTNMSDAITKSCDVYFYDLAMALGIDQIHTFMTMFGFGKKTGIDLIGEKEGLMPSRKWKRKKKNMPWHPGETLITGIGQGFTQVTSLQLAHATATLANQGNITTPRLVNYFEQNGVIKYQPLIKKSSIPLKQNNVDAVIKAMVDVVHNTHGTAYKVSHNIDFLMAGKTGTAQVFSVKQEQNYNEKEIAPNLRDHALFIAFAPVENPKIAVAVIVENGGHGSSVAAPIATKIIKQYLNTSPSNEQ